MSENYRNPIASLNKFPQFTTMNVIDGQAGLVSYSSLIFYSLTIDNILNIIVLLILAGISIAMLTGQNGILTQAQNAKTTTENKSAEEKVRLAVMGAMSDDGTLTVEKLRTDMANYKGTIEGETFPVTATVDGKSFTVNANGSVGEIVPAPEGLEVGTEVTYTPSGTYKWKAEYCSSIKTVGTDDVTLDSSNDNYKISKWKVLDIKNGKVTLVPEAPTSGTVYLGQAQGYNNGVKLLNDACSNLYGNTSKGIEARSINIEDIENYMTDDAKNGTNGAYKYNNGNAIYNTQTSTPYTTYKKYPTIYAKENLSVINGTTNNNGLGMSEQTSLVGRTDESATDGKLEASTSIQPYQTWYKDSSFMQTAFKTANNGKNYYNLLIPKGRSTYYWLASRCVNANSDICYFLVRYVYSGNVNACGMCNSTVDAYNFSRELFPVVTLSSELLSGNATDGFTVK